MILRSLEENLAVQLGKTQLQPQGPGSLEMLPSGQEGETQSQWVRLE